MEKHHKVRLLTYDAIRRRGEVSFSDGKRYFFAIHHEHGLIFYNKWRRFKPTGTRLALFKKALKLYNTLEYVRWKNRLLLE